MVDFTKRLAHAATEKPLAPAEIYQRLDRASDKGPLRPAQAAVLDAWHGERRGDRDMVLKMHTGEGKTLVGLLILQSKLNEGAERALYLCPNNFLVEQTLEEAAAFGIGCVPQEESGELPADFLDGRSILVVSVQKLFNGKTRFGLEAASLSVGAIVLDDAHACIDAIKSACEISLDRSHPAYEALVALFATDLEQQGVGTFAEIRHDPDSGAFLPVPYWAWIDRHRDVAEVLVLHAESNAVKFAWPLLRDSLRNCQCVVSARSLVISPYRAPLEKFGSYAGAAHRVFMSATLSDDSFFVKGLGVPREAVSHPLSYSASKWSGEKMVLIPSLVDDSLTTAEVVNLFAKPREGRKFGVVALVPSGEASKIWAAAGAVVASKTDIDRHIGRLRAGRPGDRDLAVVFVNRYDGIDLPDSACRVLVLDGKPFGEALLDRYLESCRPGSDVIASRVARVIEQGMGRAVRGEKDYCVVVLNRGDLVKAVRTREARLFLSEQTRTQIEIGLQVASYAAEELAAGKAPHDVLIGLVNQALRRDEGWKAFYEQRMNEMPATNASAKLLNVYAAELDSDLRHERGDVAGATGCLQRLLDELRDIPDVDRGWYLQEMARFQYAADKVESARLQKTAHQRNRYLLKPREGVLVKKLTPIGQQRATRILEWISRFGDYQSLLVVVDETIGSLRFGVRAENFERALDDLAGMLGLDADRPDKEWKEGPDNLWGLREGEYVLFECKSEVQTTRAEISRSETGQINNAVAWFAREYPGASCTRVLVIPPRSLAPGAGFNEPTVLLREKGLAELTRNVRSFFASLRHLDLRDVSEARIQEFLELNYLGFDSLRTGYYEEARVGRTRV